MKKYYFVTIQTNNGVKGYMLIEIWFYQSVRTAFIKALKETGSNIGLGYDWTLVSFNRVK